MNKISPIVVYLLPDYEEKDFVVYDEDVQTFFDQVKTETEEMYKLLEDVESNLPLHKDNFEKTEKLF